MTGLSKGWDNIKVESTVLNEGQKSMTFNFTPPNEVRRMEHYRQYVWEEDLKSPEIKLMPGFRLSWYYSGLGDNVAPYKTNNSDEVRQEFRRHTLKFFYKLFTLYTLSYRFVNMVTTDSLNENIIWNHAHAIKANLSKNYYSKTVPICTYLTNKTKMKETFEKFSKLLNISNFSDKEKKLSRKDIKRGADLFIFLNSCKGSKINQVLNFYDSLIKLDPYNPTNSGMVLYLINHMMKAPEDNRIISQQLLKYIASKLDFQYIQPNDTETILKQEINLAGKLPFIQNKDLFKTVTKHPVHILRKDKSLSPSALIPFCVFGDDMESMGTKMEQFDLPVCNSFEAKVRYDQLCYEVDLNKHKKDGDFKNQLEKGLILILDLNEERQLKEFWPIKEDTEEETIASREDKTFKIHLDTISIKYNII